MIPFSNRSCKNFLANRKKIRESITSSFQLYPINVMRNIARRGAKSDIHFIADGDMVMSEGFAIKAKNIANQMIDGKSKDVLVVRRFETKGPNIPKDHVELAWSVQNKT
uniref:Uncharacterized protein n=1 Tax=Caenorhabditis japonica TaxID=281687 RepID=A0A8R1HVN5_CAEJA